MIDNVEIKNKIIGKGYPTFIIAEMACAHQGDINLACDLVKFVVKTKADAIQIQVFKKEVYMTPTYKDWDLTTRLELSQEEWSQVIKIIKKNDLLFFAAGYDVESIKFLVEKGVDAFKIHSSDSSNPEVLEAMGKTKKPIFLSCGAVRLEEIQKAIKILRENGNEKLVLMHGYQGFPTKLEDTHLNYMKTLERIFGLNVGFYDHVDGGSILAKIIPMMAIAYGSQVIEKHFILTREDKGIDYESSLDRENFVKFCRLVRESEKTIGKKEIRDFTIGELNYRAICKKSIVLKKEIKKGSKIRRADVMFVRSDPGIPPVKFKEIEGRVAKKDLKKFYNITTDDF